MLLKLFIIRLDTTTNYILSKPTYMKLLLTTLSFIIIAHFSAQAQGCVAIRSTGGMCTMEHGEHSAEKQNWLLTTNVRYFKSFRHFKGKEEQKERLEIGNEVINYQTAVDFALTRVLNDRWSLMIDIPILANVRSSLYEHGRTERHKMHSFGIGDIRMAAYRWLLDPAKNKKGNMQLGLGIKLPTGDYDYKDYWHNVGPNGTKELRTVDQSIQLGDGGTGITAELNSYYNFSENLGVYGNFFYLSNPREQNGVRTYREMVSATLANEAIMSVPDQYMARAGVNYAPRFAKSLSATAGVRLEGIPVNDLIGGSGDFRRPGYIWSVEPGLSYRTKTITFFTSVPVAVVRNRTQSVTDKDYSSKTGTFKQGDAAFSDYTINVGAAFRF
jgi:hypothetical protein